MVLRVGDVSVVLDRDAPRGPGVATLEGLRAGTAHELRTEVDGVCVASTRFRTLRPPPGELLYRLATISDTHVGERSFGLLPRLHEDPHVATREAYATRCARAALAEAAAWGAERIVAKGDLTSSGRPLDWTTLADVLSTAPVPLSVTLGNHDVLPKAVDGRSALAPLGIAIAAGPEIIDVPGLRIVVGRSADHRDRWGTIGPSQRERIVAAVSDAAGPCLLTMHHYVDPLPVPSRYPRGIPRREGDILLRDVAAANRATLVTFGHTHRNRRGRRRGLVTTEVSSTKDYPGVWAGYAVHEGGIRQVVRRIGEPSCVAWTERTAAVLAGGWGRWTPGRLAWRCFSWTWPDR